MKNQYLYLTHDDLTFQVKFEQEGVVIDIFDAHDNNLNTDAFEYEDLPVKLK